MYLIYCDESGDEKTIVYSALAIYVAHWQNAFQRLRQFRYDLSVSDSIPVTTEFHAWKFVSGRGNLGDQIVTKQRRNAIFRNALEVITTLPDARLYNAVFPALLAEEAFEALLESINQSMRVINSHAMIIFDAGHEAMYTRLARKRQIFYPVSDQIAAVTEPNRARMTDQERILEDPFYKSSDQSYFIQMADFCSYALLRRENPLESRNRYQLNTAFALLAPILALESNPEDTEGIIRA